jgi:hypothetical protein
MGIEGDPATGKVVAILKDRNPKLKGKEYLAVFGAVSIMHLAEGLKNAGKNLSREALITGMEKIKNWKPEGMGSPVTYGPGRHHGNNSIRPCIAKGGKHVAIGDYINFDPKF